MTYSGGAQGPSEPTVRLVRDQVPPQPHGILSAMSFIAEVSPRSEGELPRSMTLRVYGLNGLYKVCPQKMQVMALTSALTFWSQKTDGKAGQRGFQTEAKIAAAAAGVWLCSEAFVPGAQVTREVQAGSLRGNGKGGFCFLVR